MGKGKPYHKVLKEKREGGSLKTKVKRELGYMKKGAKAVPKIAAKKGKEWFKSRIAEAKAQAAAERKIELEAKAAEREAYRQASLQAARSRGAARGKARAGEGGAGWRGALGQLGRIGDSISLEQTLGTRTTGKPERAVSKKTIRGMSQMESSSYLFSGLGIGSSSRRQSKSKKRKKKNKRKR